MIYIQFRASVLVAGDANRMIYHFHNLVQDCGSNGITAVLH